MTKRMTRKEFGVSVLGATLLLLIQSCGGGGTDPGVAMAPEPPAPPPPGGGVASVGCSNTIAGNHGHVLAIALADLDSATDKTYDILGNADHSHTLTLTVTQLRTLKTGASVSTSTTTNFAHQHAVVVTCL